MTPLILLLACRMAGPPADPSSAPTDASTPTAAVPSEPTVAPGAVPPPSGTPPPAPPLALIERPAEDPASDVLVVAIHGRGAHPKSFAGVTTAWSDVAHVAVPAGRYPIGRGFSWFNARARNDDLELAQGVAVAADRLAAWITDKGHGTVIVTGFSQGGMLSFTLATRHPGLVDAALPVSGFLPKGLWPTALPDNSPPIFALHGTADETVPMAAAARSVDALQALGWPVELASFDDVGHSISSPMHDALNRAVHAAAAGKDPRPSAAAP